VAVNHHSVAASYRWKLAPLTVNLLLFAAIGFNVETVQYKNLKFQVWDLGGQTSIRPYWRCYYSNTDAIIYVVDSMDRDRIGISKQELVSMLEVSASKIIFCIVVQIVL